MITPFGMYLALFDLALVLALFGVVSASVDLGCSLLGRWTS